jgi:glycosyltransferase involved in cell wall biosynthesis
MRIMMLTQFYPPLIGGEERFTYNLSRLLAARGHDVSVVTIMQDGLSAYEEKDGVRIHRINGLVQRIPWLYSDSQRRAATPFPDPGLMSELHRIVRNEKPQIVHAHNWIVHSFAPLKAISGAKLVLTLHDYGLVCAKKKLLYKDEVCDEPALNKCVSCSIAHYGAAKGIPTLFSNWLMTGLEHRLVDMFVPVSNAVAQGNGLVGTHLPVQVIPNFVPDTIGEVGEVDPQLLDQLPKQPFLLFVGAFGRYKGVDVLIEAYKRLDNPPPLVLIGYETSEYPIRTQNIGEGVTILTNWNHAAVMAAWTRCMIGFAPSVWNEPCATVPMEAMAVGKPVIATRIGGLTDIVGDGETGILVPPGNADALADAMRRLIADPALRQQMGNAGRVRVRRFQESTVVPQYEALYTQLVEQRSVPVRTVGDSPYKP